MKLPRRLAWAALAAGIAIGSLSREAPGGPPVFAEGWRVVAADFHVHAFPGDGALAPWDLRREARRRGLDVIAVTNHNQLLASRLDRLLFPAPPPPLVLMAEEVTSFGYHLSAIGIREPVDWRLPLARAVRTVHAQGGIAIVSHPMNRYAREIDDEALTLLDGIEVAHPAARRDPADRAELDALYARAARINPTIAAIGASDFHFTAPVGTCRTLVFVRELSSAGVLDAVRAGRTVAVDGEGRAYGPQQWKSLIAADNGAAAAVPAASGWNSVSVALAWLALVVLVVCGRES